MGLERYLLRSKWDRDRSQELDAHLQIETDDNIARGMTPQAARAAARKKLGNPTRIREEIYQMNTMSFLDNLARDVRYAVRGLRKNPGFTLTAVLTLGLGIGANTAIFSLLNAVMLRGLPFANSGELVAMYEDMSERGGEANIEPSPATFLSWREQNQELNDPIYEGIAAIDGFLNFNIIGPSSDPERVRGAAVSGNLFGLLGIQPIVGRPLLPEDDRLEAPRTVVLSEGLWKRRYGADRGLIGRSINLNGLDHTVVGIVPGTFQFPIPGYELWIPLRFTPEQAQSRFNFYLNVIGRLRPGVPIDKARSTTSAFTANLMTTYPGAEKIGTTVHFLHDVYVSDLRSALWLLLGTVGIVLLVACGNVAQLLLTRGAGRRQEIALRTAMGAGRGPLIRQLLTENIVLAGLGALAGIAFASSTFGYLARLIPSRFPAGTELSLSQPVLWFTLAVGMLTAILFGVGPAFLTSRMDLNEILKRGARGVRHRGHLRGLLIAGQIALTVVLLVGAGLLLRSYAALRNVDPGYATGQLLLADTDLSATRYGELPARLNFLNNVLERVENLPGVISAGYSNYAPLTMKGGRLAFSIEGRPDPEPGQLPLQMAVDRVVSDGYFSAMNIPLLEGRMFEPRDSVDAPQVTIINRTMAHTFWPEGGALGKRIRVFGDNGLWLTIIGIIEDIHQIQIDAEPEPELYLAMTQPAPNMAFFWPRQLVLRTQGDPLALASAVRQAVWSVDPQQPVSSIRTMQTVVDQEFTGRNTQMVLVASFAGLALILAAVGLYGVLSYAVAQRTPEIGLRMALGAKRHAVMGMILRRTLMLTGIGLAVGIGAALLLGRYMDAFLYGVPASDPVTYPVVAAVLGLTALVASYIPARRAAAVDPIDSLRAE